MPLTPMAARVTDMHTCPMVVPPPHVGGPILPPCSPNVIIAGFPAARVTDLAFCATGPPDVIVKGSGSVLVNSLAAARQFDQTTHGGIITLGCPTVLIGG